MKMITEIRIVDELTDSGANPHISDMTRFPRLVVGELLNADFIRSLSYGDKPPFIDDEDKELYRKMSMLKVDKSDLDVEWEYEDSHNAELMRNGNPIPRQKVELRVIQFNGDY